MEKLFEEIGLSDSKAKETIKNVKLASNLQKVIELAKCNKSSGNDLIAIGPLLYHVASKMKPQVFEVGAPIVVEYIVGKKLDSELRVNAAIEFILKNQQGKIDRNSLDEAAGVGVVVTPEQVEMAVEKAIKEKKKDIQEKR